MRITGEFQVYLDAGEVIPAKCDNCGYLWQPAEGVEILVCPMCAQTMNAEDNEWGSVE